MVNILCALKKKVHSDVVVWTALLTVFFRSSVPLLISRLLVQSIMERGMLNSPTIIVYVSFLFCLCFMCFEALLLGAYTFKIITSFWRTDIFITHSHMCFSAMIAPQCVHAKSLQLCPTLCNPMDCNPPGSSGHGILQARILEWVAMPSSRGYSAMTGRFFTPSATWETL